MAFSGHGACAPPIGDDDRVSSPEPQTRAVSPILAGLVPVLCFGGCAGLGLVAGRVIDGPSWLPSLLLVVGALAGYFLGRSILRWLYTPR